MTSARNDGGGNSNDNCDDKFDRLLHRYNYIIKSLKVGYYYIICTLEAYLAVSFESNYLALSSASLSRDWTLSHSILGMFWAPFAEVALDFLLILIQL